MDFTPVSGNEREAIAEKMQHIADLKPGDKVQWKRSMKTSKFPRYDEAVEVFRTFPKKETSGKQGTPSENTENDFSVLYRDSDGDLLEFAFDSRRFEIVPE
jgi:hypothetical protein